MSRSSRVNATRHQLVAQRQF